MTLLTPRARRHRPHHPGCRAASRATGSPVVAGRHQLGLEGHPFARGQRRQADPVGGHLDLLAELDQQLVVGREHRPQPGGLVRGVALLDPADLALERRSSRVMSTGGSDCGSGGRAPGAARAAPARRAAAAGGRADAAGAAARPRRTRSAPPPGRTTRFRAARRGTPSTALPSLASPLISSVRPRPSRRQRVGPTCDGRVVDRATRDRDVQRRLRRAADRPPAAGDPAAPGQGRRLGARALRRWVLQAAELDVAALRHGRGRARRGRGADGVTAVWVVQHAKSEDRLRVKIHEVHHDSAHELGIDPGPGQGRRRGTPAEAARRAHHHPRRRLDTRPDAST